MVPAAVTGNTIEEVAASMDEGDIIIDGGNSYYRDDLLRAKALNQIGIILSIANMQWARS